MAELHKIPEKLWKLGWRRERIIAPLARQERVTQRGIEEAAKKLELGPAMVFRLVARIAGSTAPARSFLRHRDESPEAAYWESSRNS